jgi:hypothetical protein
MPWSSWRINASVPSGGWAAAPVRRGRSRTRRRFFLRRGLVGGSAEGASSEAKSVLASRGLDGRSSSESEITFASRVLSREPSSEAEIISTVSEALGGPYRGAGPWAERDLGFPYMNRLQASEFGKDPAWVPNPVLRVLRVLQSRVRVPHSYGTRQHLTQW